MWVILTFKLILKCSTEVGCGRIDMYSIHKSYLAAMWRLHDTGPP